VNVGSTPGEQALRFIERVRENKRRSHQAGAKRIHNTPISEATVHGTDAVRYRSRVLRPGDTGYVLGSARSDGDGTYTIDGDDGEFIISDVSRDALGSNQWLLAAVAVFFYGLAAYLVFFG
jgi:hypothetical protein